MSNYPIGKEGVPWGEAEKTQWFNHQSVKRSVQSDVFTPLEHTPLCFKRVQYGELSIDPQRYPLYAFVSKELKQDKKTILVTGGVHGYETSGVHGALTFLLKHAEGYNDKFNFIIVPCVSPWGYETINRWNPSAVDPNRSFNDAEQSEEASLLMAFASQYADSIYMHIDLHETTDTDNSEFRPALAARDAVELHEWEIPDGFYTVADTQRPEFEFQSAIIDAVKKVTHIAPSDQNGKIIGSDAESEGVICYDKKSLFLCGGFTNAKYVTTTEVYPDSPSTTPENCIDAQIAAIKGGLEFISAN